MRNLNVFASIHMQPCVGILIQMVNSGLKVSSTYYSNYSNGENLNSAEFFTNIETMKQCGNVPCREFT